MMKSGRSQGEVKPNVVANLAKEEKPDVKPNVVALPLDPTSEADVITEDGFLIRRGRKYRYRTSWDIQGRAV